MSSPFTTENLPTGVQGFDPTGAASVEATVQFGEIPPDDENAIFNIPDGDGVWTDCYVINRYEEDRGLFGVGLTSPNPFQGATTAVFQLYAKTKILVSDWTVEKIGQPPVMPNPEPADDNMVLMDKHIEPTVKVTLAGGTVEDILYRISGTYFYWFLNPDQAPECWPTPPWVEPGSGECDVSPGLFVDGIICCDGNQANGNASPGNPGSENQPSNPSQAGQFPQN